MNKFDKDEKYPSSTVLIGNNMGYKVFTAELINDLNSELLLYKCDPNKG